jgi:hypothetical protein
VKLSFYLPLSLCQLVLKEEKKRKEDKLKFKFVFKAQKCFDIIYFINERCLEVGYKYEDDFAPVSGSSLKRITYDYCEHINWMRRHRIIYRRGQYKLGFEAFKYKVNWSILSTDQFSPNDSVEAMVSLVFISRNLVKDSKLNLNNLNGLEFMAKDFKNLRIDPLRATQTARKQLESDHLYPRYKLKKTKYGTIEKKVDPWGTYFSSMNAIGRIYKKNYYLKVDAKAGRLHTNLTSLPGIYFGTITVNKKPIVGYDIANSQPYFASCLLKLKLTQDIISWKKGKKIPPFSSYLTSIIPLPIKSRPIYPSIPSNLIINSNTPTQGSHNPLISQLQHIIPYSLTIMIQDSYVNRYYRDVYTFIEMCEKGDLYSSIASRINSLVGMDKQKIKQTFFQMFFSKSGNNHGIAGELKQMFPQTIGYIKQIKNEDPDTKGYYSILLQRLESEFILGKVCKRLHKEYPKAPIFTKHDSVYTTEEYRLKLLQIMHEESELLFGVSPTFRPC